MHIRLSDRHAGKAAEAPVVPRPGLFCAGIWRPVHLDKFLAVVTSLNVMPWVAA
jgi:hypothetical protein